MSRGRRIAIGLAVLAALQAGAVVLYLAVTRARAPATSFRAERLRQRRPAPDLALERPDGRPVRLAELGGRVTIIHFWATWCPPCVDELPGLLATARALDSVDLVAVSLDDDWPTVRRFFGGQVPPEILRSADHRRTNRLYDLVALPDTYLAVDGQLIFRYGGTRDWQSAGARRHLDRAVKEHP